MFEGISRLTKILVILLVTILIAPYVIIQSIGLGSSNLHIRALFWEYIHSFYFSGFQILDISQIILGTPFLILRIILLVTVIAYFKELISKNYTLILTSVLEFGPIVLTGIGAASIIGSPAYNLFWPLPTMLIVILVILYAFSIDEPETPFE
ncbi:MAG: hypothetical protein GF411_18665 [Candidatus Lokiarchaeota archaeon]|nr:hypothetical protein [Candidatus Lokiarchaeota archaeon]